MRDILENLRIHRNGKKAWAVGIHSDNEQTIREEFWAWVNHGATIVPEPNWAGENFCYFWTSPQRLYSALQSRLMLRTLNNDAECAEYKGVKRGVWPIVDAKLKVAWNNLMEIVPNFDLPRSKQGDIYREATNHDMYACRPDDDADNLGMTSNEVDARIYSR